MRKKYFLRRFSALTLSALLLLFATVGFAAEVSPAPSGEPALLSTATGAFVVTDANGGALAEGYLYESGVLAITGSGTYKISMVEGAAVPATDRIMVKSSCTIILNGVQIDAPSTGAPVLIHPEAGDVTVQLQKENVLTSEFRYAGLQKANTSLLTIEGDGKLTARGGENAAGIGGGYGSEASNITITGGTIEAIGGIGGAGIGGSNGHDGSNITITGGNVTATGGGNVTSTGGYSGAGIGGGSGGRGMNITVSGGDVTATGGNDTDCAAIGGGGQGGIDMSVMNRIELKANALCTYEHGTSATDPGLMTMAIQTPGATRFEPDAYAHLVFSEKRTDLLVEGDNAPFTYVNSVLTLTGSGTYKISMAEGATTITDRIVVESSCTIILNGVQIDVRNGNNRIPAMEITDSAGDVTVELIGNNVLYGGYLKAGLQKNSADDKKLTITGGSHDHLHATGGEGSAGIGGGYGGDASNITITGGNIVANGGSNAAGIGGGDNGAGSNIQITGGTVTATGISGAGIGNGSVRARNSGYGKSAGDITISGGMTIANSIGVPDSGAVNNVSITNGALVLCSGKVNGNDRENWNGIIFENNSGSLYGGNQLLSDDLTIPAEATLAIPADKKLTVDGATVKNNGEITAACKNLVLQNGGAIAGNAPKLSHKPVYAASGAAVTETCSFGCTHAATATLRVKSGASLVYTGSPIQPCEAAYSDEWLGSETAAISYANNTDAGEASATCTIGGKTAALTFEIQRAQVTFTAPAAETALKYNKTAQPLVKPGTATGGTMLYSLAQNGTYTEAIPTATDADTYTVYYRVEGDKNHADDAGGSVEAALAPKTLELTWSDLTRTYNGKAQAPTATAANLESGDACTVTVNGAQTDAGTYTATASAASNANYALPNDATASFTIQNAAQDAPAVKATAESIYGQHDGKITGVTDEMEYRADGEKDYAPVTDTALTGLKPGDYFVRYAAKANYNASPDAKVTVAAGASTATPTATPVPTHPTGDSRSPLAWAALLLTSGVGGLLICKKRKTR